LGEVEPHREPAPGHEGGAFRTDASRRTRRTAGGVVSAVEDCWPTSNWSPGDRAIADNVGRHPPPGPRKRPAKRRVKLSTEDLKAIDSAVASVRHRLRVEDRDDLHQELALKLLLAKHRPENVRSWARECACNWVNHLLRDSAKQHGILNSVSNSGSEPPYRRRDKATWRPSWYPPHPSAIEFAWFACDGARVMNVKPTAVAFRHVELAMVQALDSRRVLEKGADRRRY
jgi:hypothetical protein